jgi:aerobic carbon-monoxide dehydrogenase small subunit
VSGPGSHGMETKRIMETHVKLIVNGSPWEGPVDPTQTLLRFLRERLGLTGAKEGCGIGECGACTVLVDGRPVNSCMMLAVEAEGAQVRTIEGEAAAGGLSTLQRAFAEHHAVQCGFCTPGMILSARALLERSPRPTDEEIVEAIAGNLCRCTGYAAILAAVRAAADAEAPGAGGGRAEGGAR